MEIPTGRFRQRAFLLQPGLTEEAIGGGRSSLLMPIKAGNGIWFIRKIYMGLFLAVPQNIP